MRHIEPDNLLICGDSRLVLRRIKPNSVDMIITSPPYFGCREYDDDKEGLGREEDPREYIRNLLEVLQEVKPVLKEEGSFYLNMGDVYFGTKGFSRNKGKWSRKTDQSYKEHSIVKEDGIYLQHKQRLMLPERTAIAMQEMGWILRNNIIWEKPNALPCHSKDRRFPVYENIFHFVKSKKYYFNYEKAKELNHHRDVIRCPVAPFAGHMATFPSRLIEPFILTTCPENGLVMDIFAGEGTTLVEAKKNNRKWSGIENSYTYCQSIISNLKNEGETVFAWDKEEEPINFMVWKPSPIRYFLCQGCGERKETNGYNYWKRFVEGCYQNREDMENSYLCRKCRKKEK